MIIFYALLSFIIGILSSSNFLFLLAIIPFFSFIIFKYKKNNYKLYLIILSITLIIGLLRPLLYIRGSENTFSSLKGIVYKAEDKYALVATFKGNYYIKENSLEIGDIITISGKSEKAFFSHYENSFDFSSYLHHRFVDYKIENLKISFVFKAPLRLNSYKKYCLSSLNEDNQLLVSSILFGDSLYDYPNYDILSKLGITRVFTTSGLHISYLFHIFKEKYQGKKYYLTILKIQLCFTIAFYLLTGFKFCFLRISIDIILHIFLSKKKIFFNRLIFLSITSGCILLLNPYYIYEAGFIYSYIILFFLMILPIKNTAFPKLKSIITCACSYLVLLPINAYLYYEINPLSIIFSLVMIPFGLVELLLSLLLLLIPQYGIILNYFIYVYDKILSFCAKFSFNIVIGRPMIIFIILFYIILIALCYAYYINERHGKKIFSVLLSSVILILLCPKISYQDKVTFIDVGQGDSTLVTVNNKHYLFDTGGNTHIDLATSCLIPFFKKNKIRNIEAVFITHRDYDHYGALESLQKNFPINNVYDNYQVSTLEYPGIKIENLNIYREGKDTNYDSGVFYIETSKKNILIMGDAPTSIEEKIIKDHPNLKVDYLKIGHHGSDTSSSFNFLKTINPAVAVISCGYENYYGHPSEKVVGNLNALKIPYKRTDLEFTIAYIL